MTMLSRSRGFNSRSFAQRAESSAPRHVTFSPDRPHSGQKTQSMIPFENTTGRLEPELWEDDTTGCLDAASLEAKRREMFDHEAGAPLEAVPPIGSVS